MKTKKTTKKIKITSYKKAYEELLLEKQALVRNYNQLAPSISALLISRQLEHNALQELAAIRDEIIKHDV